MSKCKKEIWVGNRPVGLISHQCTRNAVKDGYCVQHHPDEEKKKELKREKRHAATPFYMMHPY